MGEGHRRGAIDRRQHAVLDIVGERPRSVGDQVAPRVVAVSDDDGQDRD